MSDHITDGVGMAFGLDEIHSRRTKAKGKVLDETLATVMARSAWEDWDRREPAAQSILEVGRRSSPVRRVLWNVGTLFVRSGQWLQDHFCVEPACA